MKRLQIALADGSQEVTRQLEGFLERRGMEVVWSVTDGQEAAERLLEKKPDVVVLDLVLPGLDGFALMQRAKANDRNPPAFIILTSIRNEFMEAEAVRSGAGYYLLKPCDEETLYERILQIGELRRMCRQGQPSYHIRISSEEWLVEKTLRNLGLPIHLRGYLFLKDAVMLCMEDMSNLTEVTKLLYPRVGSQRNAGWRQVERSIRTAVGIIWTNGNQDLVEAILGYRGHPGVTKPRNSEFIASLADYVRREAAQLRAHPDIM